MQCNVTCMRLAIKNIYIKKKKKKKKEEGVGDDKSGTFRGGSSENLRTKRGAICFYVYFLFIFLYF